jgi:uncharacterized protein (DUF58 family)
METTELIKKVRKIEIKTRGLSTQVFSGEYHSAFKGRGMRFSEVREYQPGDDIRTIDWNVTARYRKPFVKVFEEERELTVFLVIDVSDSGNFGTKNQLKKELITELSAVLAFSAIQNNDKIGVLLFSDKIEKFIPPKKGKSHTLRIIRELISFEPQSKGTDISNALIYLNQVMKKRATVFVISDFIDSHVFEKSLKITANKHDVIALKIEDPAEKSIPNLGLVRLMDSETGNYFWLDTSLEENRKIVSKNAFKKDFELKEIFKKSKVDFATIKTNEPYIRPLINLFKQR